MSKISNIETDVLVIGGGAAGARAAIESLGHGMKTTLVVKGLLGKSGCSIFAGNLNYFAPPENNVLDNKISTDEKIKKKGIKNPEKILKAYANPITGIGNWQARKIAFGLEYILD